MQVLILGAAYEKIADMLVSATMLRRRRDEWIDSGAFAQLEQLSLDAYDQMIGLELEDIVIDGCIVKAPCGGETAGQSPVDRGKQDTKRSLMVDAFGIRIGYVIAGAKRHDSLLLASTLEKLGRSGFHLSEQITVHLDAGYDAHKTQDLLDLLGCDYAISTKGEPLQAGGRWVVEHTNSWHNHGFKKLHVCTEKQGRVIEAFIALANTIITHRLIREAWPHYRWDKRPYQKPSPIGGIS